jgi:hypothetical protein
VGRGLPWSVAEGEAVGLDAGVRQPAAAEALSLQLLQESQIEGRKHQDNTDIQDEPFLESILKE